MIHHGMVQMGKALQAAAGIARDVNTDENPLVTPFDPAKAWTQAINEYVQCQTPSAPNGKPQPALNQASTGSASADTLARAKELLNSRRFGEAMPLLQQSASSGNAEAQRHLGDAYMNGRGVAQDYTQAREWYEKAPLVVTMSPWIISAFCITWAAG
jgi:TPR repeat protein